MIVNTFHECQAARRYKIVHTVARVLGLRAKSYMYVNKRILAPMVRVGTVPLRLLAIGYGADLVYSPELIAKKLAKSKRFENSLAERVF
jgi:hypothetical protein